MAIRRCPYCKAIVEEDGEYCSNCGTRLLFPEDEEIEEEIPGEKIIEDEEEEEIDIDEEEEEEEEDREEEDSEDLEDKDELMDAEEEREDLDVEEQIEGEEAGEESPIKETKGLPEEELTDEKDRGEIQEDSVEDAGGEIQKNKEPVLKTEDLQKAMDSSEKEKEEIETFLDSLKKERQQIKDKIEEVEGEIPPWAETVKEEDEEQKNEGEEHEFEQDSFEELEIPGEDDGEIVDEEVTASEEPDKEEELSEADEQNDLPFYEEEGFKDKKESVKLFKKPSIKISDWIKSRVFDVLLITGLWFITLWIASYLTSVTVFQLISNSTLAVIVFFVILLSVYLFFFLFFLGETIGDYVFPKHDS